MIQMHTRLIKIRHFRIYKRTDSVFLNMCIVWFQLHALNLSSFYQNVAVKGEPGSSNLSGSGLSGSLSKQHDEQVAGSLVQLYLCIDA